MLKSEQKQTSQNSSSAAADVAAQMTARELDGSYADIGQPSAPWTRSLNETPRVQRLKTLGDNLNHDADHTVTQAKLQSSLRATTQGPPLLQRVIDPNAFNIVGEDHSEYPRRARDAERQAVVNRLGANTYHVEDSFVGIEDPMEFAANSDERDLARTFLRKADPPYYAVLQGLHVINKLCTDFRSYLQDSHLIAQIQAAFHRVEKEMLSDEEIATPGGLPEAFLYGQQPLATPLHRVEGSAAEADFVHGNDRLTAAVEQLADNPEKGAERRKIETAVKELGAVTDTYRRAIEEAYAADQNEFEQVLGIQGEDLIAKRSATMALHAEAYQASGGVGILKVGKYHVDDFQRFGLANVTYSTNQELKEFLQGTQEGGAPDVAQNFSFDRDTAGAHGDETHAPASPNKDDMEQAHEAPIQRLSYIPLADWADALGPDGYIQGFPDFEEITASLEDWDGLSLNEKALDAIRMVGYKLLDKDDVQTVYEAIRAYFPASYLTPDMVGEVKKYNFDGPVALTAENVRAWTRLSEGNGTVDDLRYIRHELYEIAEYKKMDDGFDVLAMPGEDQPGEQEEESEEETPFNRLYPDAHHAALGDEIDFLQKALLEKYGKNYSSEQIAVSDARRNEDFLSYIYGNREGTVPMDQEYALDWEKIEKEVGPQDNELGERLEELKSLTLHEFNH